MKATPATTARRAGALYLISGAPAGFSVFVFMKLFVRNDPAATAANILGSETLFRLGFIADQVGIVLFLAAVIMLYQLFKPVNPGVSLLMAFFGVFAILIGVLAFKSTFLPRLLGVLMAIDGLGYLTFSFATFLSPPFAAHVYPFLPFATALLGEASLMLWLIVKGVDAPRWEELAVGH